jgi:hypothetical protein
MAFPNRILRLSRQHRRLEINGAIDAAGCTATIVRRLDQST